MWVSGMLRLAWLAGFITTPEYLRRKRQQQYGCDAVHPIPTSVRHFDRTLLEERIAVLVFLVGFLLLAYTFLHAPLFEK